MFHVSQHKKAIGDHLVDVALPLELQGTTKVFILAYIQGRRTITKDAAPV